MVVSKGQLRGSKFGAEPSSALETDERFRERRGSGFERGRRNGGRVWIGKLRNSSHKDRLIGKLRRGLVRKEEKRDDTNEETARATIKAVRISMDINNILYNAKSCWGLSD